MMSAVFAGAVWLGILLFELVPLIKEKQKKDAVVFCALMAVAAAALILMLCDDALVR